MKLESDREEGKDVDRWRRVVREGAKWKNSKETNDPSMSLRGQICFQAVLRGYPRLPNLSEKQHRATDKAELSATNDFALAQWQNIGLGRVGAFVEERFSRRRIRMVNGFADWVVW